MSTGVIGAKIVLDGEAQYRKALRDIKTEQAELRSEMRLAQSEYAKAQNSMDALNKKHEILSKQIETSAKKVAVYEKALQTSTEKEAKSKQKVDELTKTLAKLEAEQKSMADSTEKNSDAMKAQEEAIAKTKAQLEVATKDYDNAAETTRKYQTQLNNAQTELNELNTSLRDNEKYLDEAEKSSDGCATSIDELGKKTKETGAEVNVFGDVLKANLTSEAIIAGIKALVKGIKEIATACIESGMEFEASMSNVRALSGATNDELEIMTKKARELGASTIFSASQVADAMSYMALAGWDTVSTIAGIEPVLNLAAAGAMDLAQASDIVTDYLTAFGLTAQDAEKFTDQLAYAMANSNTTVELLGESYKNVAATAKSMGYSVEDVTAVLMTMANAGVKGGEAGTALNTIMTRLATNTKNCADKIADYGVEVYDAQGNMNSLSSILEGLAGMWGTLTDQEQAALAKSIAGTNQYSKLQTIMSGLSEDAKEAGMSFGDYQKALEDCNGSAEEMASIMQDNLKGRLTELESAMEGLKIATYDVFDENLKRGVEGATGAVSRLTRSIESGGLNVSLQKLATSSGQFIDKMVDFAEKNLPKLIDGLSGILDNADKIGAALKIVVSGLVAFKATSVAITVAKGAMAAYKLATDGATVSQILLNDSIKANPIGLIVSVAAMAAVALYDFTKANFEAIDALSETDKATMALVEDAKSLTESLNNSAEARAKSRSEMETESTVAGNLVNKLITMQEQYKNGADNMTEMRTVVDELNSAFPNLNLSIDEHTGLLNMDTDALKENVDLMLKQAKVSAAQEDLAQIAKEQYEAEKKLLALEKQREEAEKSLTAAVENLNNVENDSTKVFESNGKALTDAQLEVGKAQDAYDALNAEIEALSGEGGTLQKLTEEYSAVTEYIGENTPVVEEASESFDGLNGSLETSVTLSEEAGKRISEMYDTVSKSIKGQIDLFSEWEEKDAVATETLEKNLDSQVTALETWAENMGILSERGIDENLYAKLAEMGPQGANYVAAFVSMSEEELQGYGEKFAAALKLEDSVAEQITTDYAEVSGYILDGMALGLEDDEVVTAAMGTVAEDAYNAWKEANDINSPSKLYEEISGYIPEGMAEGIKKKKSSVVTEVKLLATETTNTAKQNIKESDFVTIGEQIDNGIIKGIDNKKGDVYEKVKELCQGILDTTEEELDINSPSKKFEWIGQMSGEGYEIGLQDSMSGISSIINGTMCDINVAGRVASRGSSPLEQIASLISEYLPEIANSDTNVNVSLQGDAKGLFNAVQKQNDVFKKTKGRSAFA